MRSGKNALAVGLVKSTWLSSYQVEGAIPPLDVVTALKAARIRSVLVGTHSLGGWMRKPRASDDVDIAVLPRQHDKAVRVLLAAFPQLIREDKPGEAHLKDARGQSRLVDVKKAEGAFYRAIFANTETILIETRECEIPSLEMSLALRFASIVSLPWSEADKYQYLHDFLYMVDRNPDIDFKKLRTLGELIYPGGGKVIAEKTAARARGEKLNW